MILLRSRVLSPSRYSYAHDFLWAMIDYQVIVEPQVYQDVISAPGHIRSRLAAPVIQLLTTQTTPHSLVLSPHQWTRYPSLLARIP